MRHSKRSIQLISSLLALSVLSACTTTVSRDDQPAYGSAADRKIPDYAPDGTASSFQDGPAIEPTPRVEEKSAFGNPPYYEVDGVVYHVLASGNNYKEVGTASWYGQKFHGRRTSSGEVYDMYQFSAAHKTLPLPSYARVTNINNGKSVIVKINDRGPFVKNRLIDLSYAAAKKLGYDDKGTAQVEVTVLKSPKGANRMVESDGKLEIAPMDQQHDNAKLYVQVGAFADEMRADTLASRLRDHFRQPISLTAVEVNGQTLQRVRIGPLESPRAAEAILAQLKQYSFGAPRVVAD
ncbi:septal ring lytic transglycosylase RlpA family protein [Kangiella sediminilitoris]|uniref:Endolytic peptidoglycan transglycosylase RlpA n=1 Tax=Kangiella sediminilitoris TaxID=1144748 RepID=A0A1B3BDA9_9GAMM|nr:septal ring lytic transglycosylase RlpA family protein [Kangiella sediminilitoris]AOE50780.1 rare lipoprotein A [Kangiella sediminilitoris]